MTIPTVNYRNIYYSHSHLIRFHYSCIRGRESLRRFIHPTSARQTGHYYKSHFLRADYASFCNPRRCLNVPPSVPRWRKAKWDSIANSDLIRTGKNGCSVNNRFYRGLSEIFTRSATHKLTRKNLAGLLVRLDLVEGFAPLLCVVVRPLRSRSIFSHGYLTLPIRLLANEYRYIGNLAIRDYEVSTLRRFSKNLKMKQSNNNDSNV